MTSLFVERIGGGTTEVVPFHTFRNQRWLEFFRSL
jgi:hypothetical protein